MDTFFIKTINLLLIAGLILGYNSVCRQREQEEQIAQLKYELEYQKQAAELNAESDDSESSLYNDGVYEGEAQGFGGAVKVQIEIENGRIRSAEIISAEHEDAAYLDAASVLTDEIIKKQTADIDTVSGATFSSNGIIHAAEAALGKAEKTND